MKYKYNKNLDLFIRHSKTVSDCRVSLNSELESITLDFEVHFQDNSLVYDDAKEKEPTK